MRWCSSTTKASRYFAKVRTLCGHSYFPNGNQLLVREGSLMTMYVEVVRSLPAPVWHPPFTLPATCRRRSNSNSGSWMRRFVGGHEHTALLQTPCAQRPDIMVEQDKVERPIGPGAVFRVESVDRDYTTRYCDLCFVLAPCDIPLGRYAVYRDPDGKSRAHLRLEQSGIRATGFIGPEPLSPRAHPGQ